MKCSKLLWLPICLSLCGCSTPQSISSFSPASIPKDELRSEIIKQASQLGIEDGYFFGEEPRNFKTPYSVAPPAVKADFALDYEAMLGQQGEDMISHWESYVPYSKRSQFAREWWSKHSDEFNKQTEKYKILWIHEALLDGGELWFRAVEKLAGNNINSIAVLTHDEEQRFVFKYAESEQSEGSLSTQFH
ncbi:MAG TPA: hypothetical protein V6C69_08310 [Trichormus sp.]|jgi:hypothetical protein